MSKAQSTVSYFLKIFIFIVSIFSVIASASEDPRIKDQLASKMPPIPLEQAMGTDAYNDAIGTGKYRYVGNSKCRLCHRKFFIGRKKDPHDHTMQRLTEGGYENNPNCLTCHSTGFRTPSGFVSTQQTPRLSNVQCEGCHGPGNVHIEMAKDKMRDKADKFVAGGFLAGTDNPVILKNMCIACHTKRWDKSYHDLDRAYDTYKSADPTSKQKPRHAK